MVEKVRVLIFPAGSEIAHDIHASLRYNLHVEVFGASGKADNARFIYDQDHYFEDDFYVTKPEFVDKFNDLLVRNHIDIVMPTHDTIALFFAKNADKIKAKVLTSTYETALIAREKKLTYDLFRDTGLCPEIYNAPFDNLSYPVFLKPNIGEGAKRTVLCSDKESVLYNLEQSPDLLVCEYLPGEELSVDCFTDKDRKILFVGPRTRERVQMGISFHSASVPLSDEIYNIAKIINDRVNIRGTWFFQVKKDKNGKYKLMEFAVRQASTMGLFRQVGINFALLSVFDSMGMPLRILKNDYAIELERSLYNRYRHDMHYSAVYFDFDDCIVIDDCVNESAIRFLYYCRKHKKRVVLLTKHRYDIYQTLEKYCIHTGLFDEIIVINEGEHKADYIKEKDSIFIDNYFFEREIVKQRLNIPVFDVDAIESLL